MAAQESLSHCDLHMRCVKLESLQFAHALC